MSELAKAYVWLYGFAACFLFFAIGGLDSGDPALFAVFGFLGVGVLVGAIFFTVKNVKALQASANMEYVKEQMLLKIFNISESNADAVKISADLKFNHQHHDAELVYTSATVGGITTGGFHINEAYNTSTVAGRTGKYSLWYKGRGSQDGSLLINKIKLPPPAVNQAAQSRILSEFLQGDTLVLKHNVQNDITPELRKQIQNAYNENRPDIAALLTKDFKDPGLTKEECIAVINFISGK